MRVPWRGSLSVVVSIAACSRPSGYYDPFERDPTVTPVSSTGIDANTSATGGGATMGGDDTNPIGSTGSTPTGPDGTDGPSDTTGVQMSTGNGGSDGGTQPPVGMYSSCRMLEECGPAPDLCVTLFGLGGTLLGGFCSQTGCDDPVADCDPSPGGTAVPVCVEVNVEGMDEFVCALDCEDEATCPDPMECVDVGVFGHFCV
ncbi:MAG: hypothetical protein K0V04_06270 [Deltaproteobacteria bacterium]|nr:hypothetical protein [Deltaproteobacteria bacterium]